ncbi:MAG: ATP-dependent DNA helicase RecG [Tissierellia bacterium]|nr:ATP-dependent DNA helicase RecG [Tissierellia bacterium]
MSLEEIKGIGPKKKEKLNKLEIFSIKDLCNYYPNSYEDRSKKMDIKNAKSAINYYFEFIILSYPKTHFLSKNKSITTVIATDGYERVKIVWFNNRFIANTLNINQKYKFYTKLNDKNPRECFNPTIAKLKDDSIGGIYPIYSLTKGISQNDLRKFILKALDLYDFKEEIIPKLVKEKFNLNSREMDLIEVHRPSSVDKLLKSKSNIKIEDFVRQLFYLKLLRDENTKYSSDGLNDIFFNDILEELNFDLTHAQLKALTEIISDLKDKKVMNRLLCGDVGSGKTIVAIISMMIVAKNGYQCAMMVPTEVLATQHFKNNINLIEKFNLRACLLTGSISKKDKNNIYRKIKEGECDIVIGTHALIQKELKFKNLFLVINDEQHRFGVTQRKNLSDKGQNVNYLTMTATPIPRTMSLRLNKILDLSIIDQLPKGRIPITTKIIHQKNEILLVEFLKKQLKDKRQVYIVSSNIDADDQNSTNNLLLRYRKFFPNYRIEALHGKMKNDQKEQVFKDFNNGQIDILISTTIIEVGVDVKNANTMIIYNANNFGLSQLHQLRGRVGRGNIKSYCIFVSLKAKDKKLEVLKNNDSGIEIAKFDLELRGSGRIFSTMQHGKDLNAIDNLNMTKEELDKAFDIFEFMITNKIDIKNKSEILKFYNQQGKIVLN